MNVDNTPSNRSTGFLDRKIIKANFNIEPEHILRPGQLERVSRFLRWHNPPPPNDAIDVIVVTTTSPYFDLVSFNKRATAALEYSRLYPEATVIFTGKRPDLSRATQEEQQASYSEAKVMADVVIDRGLDTGRILLEELSLHTGQSIKYTVDMLFDQGFDPSRSVVTSSSYMARRISYYLKRELRIKGIAGRINPYVYDADVNEDLRGGEFSTEDLKRKYESILYEAKRLSAYRQKGDL